jgi:hypothetical protein
MTRKLVFAGIVLVGLVLAMGNNAWAGQGQHGKRHYHAKGHHAHKAHPGHHYGWTKGRQHAYRRCDRHHRVKRHRGHARRPVVVEKHVYHNYQAEEPAAREGFDFGFTLSEDAFGVSVAVNRIN